MARLLLPEKYKNPPRLLRKLGQRPESYWMRRGERRVLRLFHAMAACVPAYKDFLKRHRITASRVKSIRDFKKVPLISKDSYLRKYPLASLCWDGKFVAKHWDISSTSGSTGEPFYFPRDDSQNAQYAATAELYLRSNFEIHKKSTLYVNCFALGVWIGGLFTYEALKLLARRGRYALTVINPGLNKIEIIKAVRNLGEQFDQVILGGYPPFIKDILDDGIRHGLKWKKYNLKIIFSAEGFSEEFRNYIKRHAGLRNIYRDTLNHYGTVDQGTIAHETPFSVMIRRLAVARPKLFKLVFREDVSRLPTLCQYDPELFYFEEVNDGVVCSSYSGLPLVRYDLKDHGGVVGFDEFVARFQNAGVDLFAEARRAGISDTIWRLPFVYVYERKDMSVTLYGLNIYPETIRRALHHRAVEKLVTGKCVLATKTDSQQDQYLEINIEAKNGARIGRVKRLLIQTFIIKRLLRDNSEYRKIYAELPRHRTAPRIVIWPYEHPAHFRLSGKQKWTIRSVNHKV